MRYQQIGDIAIFNKITKAEAKNFIKKFPRFKSIFIKKSRILGKYRKPNLRLILSQVKEERSITTHTEHGTLYKLDVTKAMFSQGNLFERHRIAKKVSKNMLVVDMFAGIGYFSIPFAKHGARVYAIELAGDSFDYLKQNAKLNKVEKNLFAINGDSKKEVMKLAKQGIKADIISMGYIPTPLIFFKYALKISKKGTLILFHCLLSKYSEKEKKDLDKLLLKLKKEAEKEKLRFTYSKHFVKSFSPGNDHWVLEIKLC